MAANGMMVSVGHQLTAQPTVNLISIASACLRPSLSIPHRLICFDVPIFGTSFAPTADAIRRHPLQPPETGAFNWLNLRSKKVTDTRNEASGTPSWLLVGSSWPLQQDSVAPTLQPPSSFVQRMGSQGCSDCGRHILLPAGLLGAIPCNVWNQHEQHENNRKHMNPLFWSVLLMPFLEEVCWFFSLRRLSYVELSRSTFLGLRPNRQLHLSGCKTDTFHISTLCSLRNDASGKPRYVIIAWHLPLLNAALTRFFNKSRVLRSFRALPAKAKWR